MLRRPHAVLSCTTSARAMAMPRASPPSLHARDSQYPTNATSAASSSGRRCSDLTRRRK